MGKERGGILSGLIERHADCAQRVKAAGLAVVPGVQPRLHFPEDIELHTHI